MALYSEEFIDEVKSANDIVDVVSGYVNLKRHGSTFFGNCPFHQEKTASFAVTPDKQIFHCFGCGVGGNVLNFIMKAENIGFKESIEFLADRAKIPLPVLDGSKESMDELKIKDYHKSQMYEINKESGRFFHQNIYSSNIAKEYIASRKLNINTIRKFGIGFAKDDNSLLRHLKSKGFKEDDMIATGLIGKASNGMLYDKFKNRLMFPIFDIRGRVVAFGGRALGSHEELKEKHIPKYVNSPENLIYTKGNHLYGLNIAKQSNNSKLGKLLVVEGYMDVVSPQSYGVTNVVASLGTALTENQGKLLRQYAEEVILSYDSDAAGQNAILRGIDVLQKLNVMCKVLVMEGAKDPDEYVLKYGPERLKKLIDNSISAVEYKIRILRKNYNLSDTTDKIKFLNKIAEILAKVPNNIERDIYIESLSKEVGVGKEALVAEIEKILFNNKGKEKTFLLSKSNDTNIKDSASTDFEESILYILLNSRSKNVYEKIKNIVSESDFSNQESKSLLSKVYASYANDSFSYVDFSSLCDTEKESNLISKILMKPNYSDDYQKITDEVISNYKMKKNENRKKELVELIKDTTDEQLRHSYEYELNSIIQNTPKN